MIIGQGNFKDILALYKKIIEIDYDQIKKISLLFQIKNNSIFLGNYNIFQFVIAKMYNRYL
jgi:hypothetical protein